MKDERILFDTAKLAKEKGFMESGDYPLWYHSNGEEASIWKDFWNIKKEEYPNHEAILRPTQSLLQRWLRDVHKIDIFITKTNNSYSPSVYGKNISYHAIGVTLFGKDKSYKEALELGIITALKLIK